MNFTWSVPRTLRSQAAVALVLLLQLCCAVPGAEAAPKPRSSSDPFFGHSVPGTTGYPPAVRGYLPLVPVAGTLGCAVVSGGN